MTQLMPQQKMNLVNENRKLGTVKINGVEYALTRISLMRIERLIHESISSRINRPENLVNENRKWVDYATSIAEEHWNLVNENRKGQYLNSVPFRQIVLKNLVNENRKSKVMRGAHR